MNFLRFLGSIFIPTKEDMGIRIWPFDPIQLIFNVMNALMKKGLISFDESRDIIRWSLPQEMTSEEKENLINSLITKNPNG